MAVMAKIAKCLGITPVWNLGRRPATPVSARVLPSWPTRAQVVDYLQASEGVDDATLIKRLVERVRELDALLVNEREQHSALQRETEWTTGTITVGAATLQVKFRGQMYVAQAEPSQRIYKEPGDEVH